ncbi:thiamine-phosphate kinase [Candidatus Woesearchaeota archaeon]|nr:thiamine-phosphate kinase [Candidatus Woesearchaeota archaeon]
MSGKIRDEVHLLESIKRRPRNRDVVVGIDDDVAVVRSSRKSEFHVYTTDILIEDVHFSRKYFTPEQIGMKAIEVNVSDIAAIGGTPEYCLVSIGLPEVGLDYVKSIYKGMGLACRRHGIDIIGGDTSKSEKLIINVAMTGSVKKKDISLRSTARSGDLICVTGHLGESEAGRLCINRKIKSSLVRRHLEPRARLDLSRKIAPFATSMIDLSDGLATDLRHICRLSKKGCRIYHSFVPVSGELIRVSGKMGLDPYKLALYGGEDYELLFTIPRKNLGKIRCRYFIVGVITSGGCVLSYNNKIMEFGRGYDHFR